MTTRCMFVSGSGCTERTTFPGAFEARHPKPLSLDIANKVSTLACKCAHKIKPSRLHLILHCESAFQSAACSATRRNTNCEEMNKFGRTMIMTTVTHNL